MEDNHIEVIGVDHGWANCKTVGSVFVSGVKEISTEPGACQLKCVSFLFPLVFEGCSVDCTD